jgi:shikimate dehydrogenase
VPFKESVLPFIDEISESAAAIGAVNTVVFDKKTSGYNTDAEGFRLMLADGGWPGSGRRLVMLGSGGAARAVLYALKNSFEQIVIINRDISRAEKLSSTAIIKDWAEAPEFLHECDLLVNTTSLGMKGQPELELDISNLPVAAFVADIVYVPEKTGLLQRAEARGNRIIGGIGMLLHQAAAAFELWHGIRPEIDGALVGKLAEELKIRLS